MLTLDAATLLSRAAYGQDMFVTEAQVAERGERLAINVPEGARVATSRAERWELSATNNPKWRWSQGGALPLMRLRDAIVAPLQLSDSTLPLYANHLTAATGLASSPEEWVNPRRLMREAFEEIAIATPTGIAIPIFNDPELDTLSFGTLPGVLSLIEMQSDLPDLFHLGVFNRVRAQHLPLRGERSISVSIFGRIVSHMRAVAVLDETTRGVDIMHAYQIDLRAWRLDEISLFCAESRDGVPTNSEIACLEFNDDFEPLRIIRSFKTGKAIEGTGSMERISPVLRATLASL